MMFLERALEERQRALEEQDKLDADIAELESQIAALKSSKLNDATITTYKADIVEIEELLDKLAHEAEKTEDTVLTEADPIPSDLPYSTSAVNLLHQHIVQ